MGAGSTTFLRRVPGIGLGLVILCAVAATAGSYLSATKVITVRHELTAYRYLIAGAAIGAMLCWAWQPTTRTRLGRVVLRLLVGGVAAVGVVAVLEAWGQSNQSFMYWTLRSVPPASWAEMAKELRTLGAQSLNEANGDYVRMRNAPAVVDQVGRRGELSFVTVQRFSSEPDDFVVRVQYGYKSRRWALCSGAAAYCTGDVPRRPTQKVAEGLFFVMWTE